MPNRLAQESSLYLRQHAENPVDWYAWGDEALDAARKLDRPILLSVGYSACHWCHVMAHECFENPEIARQMNAHFICIKVDREERPDLDQIFQNVAQAMTRGGGWPLTVFLTPELKPFYGGTYFPPEDRYGRPGFPRLLEALAQAYRGERSSIEENVERLGQYIAAVENLPLQPSAQLPSRADFQAAARSLLGSVDWENGGFGGAPKFPQVSALQFLWRVGTLDRVEDATQAVLLSLRKMACGGIFDQIGGGFHRYSVDEKWAVPHFEKMLYDNGALLKLYSEVVLTGKLAETDRDLFLGVIQSTTEYLLREMRDRSGLFYSAQDADSEGEEGKFFVWDEAELREAGLNEAECRQVASAYGITPEGNFEHQKTVLYRPSMAALGAEVSRLSHRMFVSRLGRVAPATDRKQMTSWNALAVSGLSWAAMALRGQAGEDRGIGARASEAAQAAWDAIVRDCAGPETLSLLALSRASQVPGRAPTLGFLDDYAMMIAASVDLHRAFGRDDALVKAREWARKLTQDFRSESGGFYFSEARHQTPLVRPKTFFDQSMAAGVSLALSGLVWLEAWEPGEFSAEIEFHAKRLARSALENVHGCGELLCALLLLDRGAVVVDAPEPELRGLAPHPHWLGRSNAKLRQLCHLQTCERIQGDLATALTEKLQHELFR